MRITRKALLNFRRTPPDPPITEALTAQRLESEQTRALDNEHWCRALKEGVALIQTSQAAKMDNLETLVLKLSQSFVSPEPSQALRKVAAGAATAANASGPIRTIRRGVSSMRTASRL
jgi:hypothetical protein